MLLLYIISQTIMHPIDTLYNIILWPKYLPFGSEIKEIIINKDYVIKKYRKNKLNALKKSIIIIKKLEKYSFVPKLLYHDDNTLKQEFAGDIVNIRYNLPHDWKEQLDYIRDCLVEERIIIPDLDIWNINPVIINNLCVKNNKLYLIDFGECYQTNRENILQLFNKLEQNIIFAKDNHILILIFFLFIKLIYLFLNSVRKKLYKLGKQL